MKIKSINKMKRIGFLLTLVILVSYLRDQDRAIAATKTPVLSDEEIELEGAGDDYQLEVLNKKAKSTYQWSSSNKSVATVTKKGLVTAVNKGTARIKCSIKYSSGTIKNLYCYVTVTIPAEKIEINNANDSKGTHVMRVGETYNFNRTLTPSKSSDKTYWSLDASDEESNPNAVQIVNSSNGTVKALRGGKIVLVATAAKESTAKAAKKSIVKDAIIIEVVGPSAEVVSADIINAKTIKVLFGTAIRPSTVINTNGTLTNNISVTPMLSSSGEAAKDPGILTGSLSGDMKTLTITVSNYLYGEYGISFTDGILTSDGTRIYKDYLNLKYSVETPNVGTGNNDSNTGDDSDTSDPIIDTEAPKTASIVLDDDGMTNIITFTEKMDFTGFQVNNAAIVGSSGVKSSTISYLNTESNYIFSSDGKSILINMSDINPEDYNKAFNVTISGITDTSGNRLANGSITVGLKTNTSPREQARPISVVRSSYDTITATFSRSIKTPGYAYINHYGYYNGEVNPDNDRQVNYRITSYDATLTGTQTVSIGFWNSYNVLPGDTYANKMYDFNVYFTTEQVRPILTTYSYNPSLKILTLTFNEEVHLYSDMGYLSYTMDSSQYGNSGMLYYSLASKVNNVIELMLYDMTLFGNYTFTLPEGFALDNYRNQSYSRTLTINNGTGSGSTKVLAEPYSIQQSTVNHSFIYIYFADKLDTATALDADNYYIAGTAIDEVKLISNTTDGAQVRLTLEKGTLTANGKRKITITGLKGFNGSAAVMADYSTELELKENKDPELVSIKYNAETRNTINLTFSEEVKGNMTVTIRERATGAIVGNSVTIAGKIVTITLDRIPNDGTYLNLYVQNNSITDLNDNESTIDPILYAFVNY